MNKWLKRITEYYQDKKLAEKCGLGVKDICVHEWVTGIYTVKHCKKCGESHK